LNHVLKRVSESENQRESVTSPTNAQRMVLDHLAITTFDDNVETMFAKCSGDDQARPLSRSSSLAIDDTIK